MKVKLDEGAFMPERAHEWDAGADLRTPHDIYVAGEGYTVVNTGIHVEIPSGYVGMVKSKSGLMCKHGIVTDGTVDAGYTGSIRVCLYNRDGTSMSRIDNRIIEEAVKKIYGEEQYCERHSGKKNCEQLGRHQQEPRQNCDISGEDSKNESGSADSAGRAGGNGR